MMEVDPKKSLGEFKGLVDQLIGSAGAGDDGRKNEFGTTLRDLGEIFDTLPAGTGETVCIVVLFHSLSHLFLMMQLELTICHSA